MPTLIRLVLLAVAFAAGTRMFGWWAVPTIAALWGLIARGAPGSAVAAAMAAVLAWSGLLGFDALSGRVGALLARIGPLFTLPGVVLIGVTLLLAALLAWSAAATFGGLMPRPRERMSS